MDGQPEPVGELLTETELKPVRPGRASGVRARLLVAAWLLGLAGVAGLAVVGRLPGPAPTPAPAPDEAITRPNPPRAAEVRPTLGEDGLMGGLVFPDS